MSKSKIASLKDYRAKRNFAKSPEPAGSSPPPRTTKRPRATGSKGKDPKSKIQNPKSKRGLFFCVQKHLASHLHYDFRLEHDGVLVSWAVPKGPSVNPADKRLAMKVEDHPFDYGDFEGVIPEGYGAGIVMLWDRGTYVPEVGPDRRPGDEKDVAEGLRKGELKFRLDGVKLKGSWVLVRTGGRPGTGESRTWLLIKHRDKWSAEVDITAAAPLSVKSFGDFPDILAEDIPSVWTSNRPAQGGAAGAMFRRIITRAMEMKKGKRSTTQRAQSSARKTTRAKANAKK